MDFVAGHKNKTYLQAIRRLNHNPRLLLLEQHMGALSVITIHSISQRKTVSIEDAAGHMTNLMQNYGLSEKLGQTLFEKGYAQVNRKELFVYFPKK